MIRSGTAAACGAVLVLAVVIAGAAAIVKSLPASVPAGTDVAAADASGVNLLEPAATARNSEKKVQLATGEAVERVVGEWTPTGGGGGGGGSPKH